MSFDLASISRAGGSVSPQRVLIYGVQGLGKTTFGCTFPHPVLLRVEDGAGALSVPCFPEVAATWQDLVDAVSALHGEHPYKTLVLDSLDWMEPLVWAKTCADLGIRRIEDAGYGKGYVAADDNWRYLLSGLDSLRRERGMTIVVVAHAETRRYSPPDGEAYDRYQIRVQQRSAALWQEWADMVLFCNYERRMVGDASKGEKRRAEGSGDRVIFTEERPAWLAKNRWSLPPRIFIGQDRTWAAFHQALADAGAVPANKTNRKEESHEHQS